MSFGCHSDRSEGTVTDLTDSVPSSKRNNSTLRCSAAMYISACQETQAETSELSNLECAMLFSDIVLTAFPATISTLVNLHTSIKKLNQNTRDGVRDPKWPVCGALDSAVSRGPCGTGYRQFG